MGIVLAGHAMAGPAQFPSPKAKLAGQADMPAEDEDEDGNDGALTCCAVLIPL